MHYPYVCQNCHISDMTYILLLKVKINMSDTFILNGKETPFKQGQMILEAVRNAGIEIPTLCYLKGSTPTGACRICLIEVKGARSLQAACSTPASPGMEVFTDTEVVHRSRKLNIELLLASGNIVALPVRPTAIAACRIWPTSIKSPV